MDETEETRAQNDAATSTPEDDSIDNKSRRFSHGNTTS